ncbi:glycerophosphoryl diester phosphodiesterase [Mycobacteroides abscessus subsp. bolletii 50594]|uniref:Glycerophosphoryl diester phosphodiesterase n=1 Tax=Mycobacteroides abscessus subsp. bolletii 50594 TaxID=1303024 RepID=A0AB33A4T3_9MYCO|nr:glycerophosphoryl diester phosphodiesterase [Mycobacteroides abscessus subsp. bolletii 50594]
MPTVRTCRRHATPIPALRLNQWARNRQHWIVTESSEPGEDEAHARGADGIAGRGERHPFVVAHRGASADRPEHTLAAYELALEEGADGVECDVRLTRDGQLVCVHDRRVDRTSDGTGLVSEMTLSQLRALDFGSWHPGGAEAESGTGLLTLEELVSLVLDWNRPVKLFIETKHPVRYGSLAENKVLALLHRFGIAAPASADMSRAVVMSFSAAAVWRIRRAAPMLPTVLLGETSRYLGGSAATTVGATAVGPSIATLREHPELVDRAAAQGRATYCWTVDHYEDVEFCRSIGVAWIATNHPGRTKSWLQRGLTGTTL